VLCRGVRAGVSVPCATVPDVLLAAVAMFPFGGGKGAPPLRDQPAWFLLNCGTCGMKLRYTAATPAQWSREHYMSFLSSYSQHCYSKSCNYSLWDASQLAVS